MQTYSIAEELQAQAKHAAYCLGLVISLGIILLGGRQAYAASSGSKVPSGANNGAPANTVLGLPQMRNTIINSESKCSADLAVETRGMSPKDSNARDAVNDSHPYKQIYWISPQQGVQDGHAVGDFSEIVVQEGATSVPLQLNVMQFNCAILVNNNAGRLVPYTNTLVRSNQYPNNRSVYPDNPTKYSPNNASRLELRSYLQGMTVVGGGAILGVGGGGENLLLTSRVENSRYWQSTQVDKFTYRPPSGAITRDTTVTITYLHRDLYTYHEKLGRGGDVNKCLRSVGTGTHDFGSINDEGDIPWGQCEVLSDSITFTIKVKKPRFINLRASANCTVTGGAIDDSNTSSQLEVRVYPGASATGTYVSTTTVGSSHSFSVPISAVDTTNSWAWSSRQFYVEAYGVNASGAKDGTKVSQVVTAGPCAQVECDATSFMIVPPGTPMNFWVSVRVDNVSIEPPSDSTFTVNVTGVGAGTNSQAYTVSPELVGGKMLNGGTIQSTSMSFTPAASGKYTVTWRFRGQPAGSPCSQTGKPYMPYFEVHNGDIAAGVGFGSSACVQDNRKIRSWNKNATGSYKGAGTEAGAWATGTISNFVSGMGLQGGAASHTGFGLSFSNTNALPSGSNYGGDFGGLLSDSTVPPCLPDYYNTLDTASAYDATMAGPLPMGSLASGAYKANGVSSPVIIGDTSSLHIPVVISPNTTITLYVSGNLLIKSNILYSSYTIDANTVTVPRLNVYVQGNIYIDPAVTELHGVFMAQQDPNDPNTGTITTCQDTASSSSLTQSYSACSNPLRVVGAMSAEGELRLNRTHGSLVGDPGKGINEEPAEIFEYSPELWLNMPASTGPELKSYTSLPPVL